VGTVLIQWDQSIPVYTDEQYRLRNHFGVSQRVQNCLTVLELLHSSDWVRVHKDIVGLRAKINQLDQGPSDQEIRRLPYGTETARGLFEIVVLWGTVLNGGRSKGALTGAWYFIIVHCEEEQAVMRQVFKR